MHEECQYLDLLKTIYTKGIESRNRTKINSTKIFGQTMRFDLSGDKIPVFTTKKLFFKGVVHELLWFMRGDTNCKYLQENGVHIWDLDAKRFAEKRTKDHINSVMKRHMEMQDNVKIDEEALYKEMLKKYTEDGDLGPIYGHQWRNFNSQGIDQLAEAIEKLQYKRNDRRIVISAWNPAQTHEMALPACHVLFQFGVEADKYLTCALYQRSCDFGLGVPFNVASYSLLTHIVAKATGLVAKEFIWFGFDCHIYDGHREAILEQISRKPFEFPTIEINEKITNAGTDILKDDFLKYNDFTLKNYKHHPPIKMELADYL